MFKNLSSINNKNRVKNKANSGTYIGRLRFDAKTATIEEDKAIVYPNPGGGFYYFKFKNEKPQEYKLVVTSLSNGKAVIEETLMINDCGEIVISNNFNVLAHGTYLFRFTRVADDKLILDEKVQKY